MAKIIELTMWNSSLDTTGNMAAATSKVLVNVNSIISVQTRATAYQTTGVSNVLISVPLNQTAQQVQLIVTEARSAILTAANANAAAV